ncbi:MAG TPA: flagellar hook-associated protein FlgK [Opitutaceae bacterium]|nr:flagellar hook-associated protein FlgK [Opitutaceae bacterium]
MSGLYSTLNASVTSLNAQSVAIDTTGKNLANVNSSTYSREVVNFGSLGTVVTPTGPESTGLTALGVEQIRSSVLDQQVMSADSQASYYTTQQSAYQQAQAGLGQTVSSADSTSATQASTDSGVGAALDDLFNAFQSLAANPTDTGTRQALLQSASILTDRLQSTDANLAQVQSGLNSQVTGDVTSANGLLTSIAQLNGQISRLEVGNPGSAVDLRDQRQADLEQLAAIMPIKSVEQANGTDQISSVDGSGNSVTLVSNATVTGALTFNSTTSQISAGSPSTVLALSSGSIQGALDASTGGIQTLRDNLNSLANQLVTSVNAVYNPTGTTGNFFTSTGTTAATISIDPTVTAANLKASDGGPSGDNTVALGIANLANQTFSTAGSDKIDGTFDSFYAGTVSGFGQTLSGVNSQVADQNSIQTIVTNQRDAVSGVNLDEEMANLLKYQRSYQASAQVFQTVDSLLDTVITTLGTITS